METTEKNKIPSITIRHSLDERKSRPAVPKQIHRIRARGIDIVIPAKAGIQRVLSGAQRRIP
ncbi:MAG: hypothetical protein LBI87_10465 [Candidatus Accumulibacter sp.]|jgi:biotin operon repressor|nr:hypothetical protein [Accumulibacter sp.]